MTTTLSRARRVLQQTKQSWQSHVKTARALHRNATNTDRRLEIGPGKERIQGFETLNIIDDGHTDYVRDAAAKLPFPDDTFILIYASHVVEHIPWYQTVSVLREWVRVLVPEGSLEVWVPNGLKICSAFVDAEEGIDNRIPSDGWYKFNEERDPCKWAAGRIFTYGDGTGQPNHPNWHRSIFSPRYLHKCLKEAGLRHIRELNSSEVRGYDHGWINLGMTGTK
jgi:SAM-dependent methyltransferase